MSLIPTLIAVAIGAGLGIRWGGQVSNVSLWRPHLWETLAAGLVLLAFVEVIGITGGFGALLVLLGTGALIAFAVFNIRVGGMVLILIGLGSNFVVTLLNWGRPVSASALTRAGVVKEAQLSDLVLTGGRSTSKSTLGFLGDVIPLPWGQVISIGDVLLLVGLALVTASLICQRSVGGGPSPFINQRGPAGYRSALDALGRGPAPRRGPGLHPSRLGGRRERHRSPSGRRPR